MLKTPRPKASQRWAVAEPGVIFEPPQPWKMPTTGQEPSTPPGAVAAGGNATDTSIGMPSHVGVVVFDAAPHWRWPAWAAGVATVVHVTVPKTLGIAASAAAGASRPRASRTVRASSLRTGERPWRSRWAGTDETPRRGGA